MSKPILHAEFLKAWADGEALEYQMSCNPSEVWGEVTRNHALVIFESGQYKLRIKPRTILINGIEVPEPVLEPLKIGQQYWVVAPNSEDLAVESQWDGDTTDYLRLERGLIRITKEEAQKVAHALISLTKIKGE